MGQLENNLMNKDDRTLTKWERLWRCNSGSAWEGEFLTKQDFFERFKIKIFFPVLINLRKVLLWPKGTPDKIGFRSMIITPDMVGKRVAVFMGSEYKAGKNDKLGKKQREWRDSIIVPCGGIHRHVKFDGSVVESGFNLTDNNNQT
jgi:hypothetical protein